MNWHAIRQRHSKCKREYVEYLGEVEEIEVEEEEMYKEIKRLAEEVQEAAGVNRMEIVYQEWMAYKLEDNGVEVKMEKVENVEKEENEISRYRLDIYLEELDVVIEMKTCKSKRGVEQLKKYLKDLKKKIGFLIQYVKGKVEVLMIFEHTDKQYYIYDGENCYRHAG